MKTRARFMATSWASSALTLHFLEEIALRWVKTHRLVPHSNIYTVGFWNAHDARERGLGAIFGRLTNRLRGISGDKRGNPDAATAEDTNDAMAR